METENITERNTKNINPIKDCSTTLSSKYEMEKLKEKTIIM